MKLDPKPIAGEVDDLRLGYSLKPDTMAELVERQNVKLSAELALLATRIGKFRRAKELLANVRSPADVDKAPNVPNLCAGVCTDGRFRTRRVGAQARAHAGCDAR